MGVTTNLTITDGVLVFTTEMWTLIRVLMCTVLLITLLLISLLMLYKWTGQRHNVTGLDTTTPPTADVHPGWDMQDRRQRGTEDSRREEKTPDPYLDTRELKQSETRRRLIQAEQAAQCKAHKKKQKRMRNKHNKWYRENVSQLDWSNMDNWSDFCNNKFSV
jgi:hypothetical protein